MDYVIPRCLFLPQLLSDMVTVLVCEDCNNEKSMNDSYFRDLLAIDLQTSEHQVAKTLFKNKILKAVQKNRGLRSLAPGSLPNQRTDAHERCESPLSKYSTKTPRHRDVLQDMLRLREPVRDKGSVVERVSLPLQPASGR